MLLEATHKRVRYRSQDGQEIVLPPGVPTEVEEQHAVKILEQAKDKVRRVLPAMDALIPHGGRHPETGHKSACMDTDSLFIEPARKWDGSPLSPVYWERSDGSILGPASLKFFDRRGRTDGLIIEYSGEWRWINADQLRSKQQWMNRKPVVALDGFAPKT